MNSSTPTSEEAENFRRDAQLVEESMTDNRDAQRALLERLKCVPRMLAAKNARMGRILSDTELEDLTQETILAIWRKRDQFNGYSTLETWVFPFCYHNLMNRIRKRGNRPRTVQIEAADSVAATVEDDYGFVYDALDELGPPDEEIVRLKHFEQLSFNSIGKVLGISPNTAKSRYYRGVDRLRVLLAPHGRENER